MFVQTQIFFDHFLTKIGVLQYTMLIDNIYLTGLNLINAKINSHNWIPLNLFSLEQLLIILKQCSLELVIMHGPSSVK